MKLTIELNVLPQEGLERSFKEVSAALEEALTEDFEFSVQGEDSKCIHCHKDAGIWTEYIVANVVAVSQRNI